MNLYTTQTHTCTSNETVNVHACVHAHRSVCWHSNSRVQNCAKITAHNTWTHTHISRWAVCILTTRLLHFHTWIFFWDSQRWFQSHTHRYWETGTVGWEFKWKAFLVLGALQLHMVFEQHATFWILGELQSLYVSLQKSIRSSDSGFNRNYFLSGYIISFSVSIFCKKRQTGNEHGRKRRRKGGEGHESHL